MTVTKCNRVRGRGRDLSRRTLLRAGAGAAGLAGLGLFLAPRLARGARPAFTDGIQSGDVSGDGAVLWARADRPARVLAEWATTESLTDVRRMEGPLATGATDLTAQIHLLGLPPGQDIFYRLQWQDAQDATLAGETMTGRLRTPPAAAQDVTFTWSGDITGQGWGINPDWGGFKGVAAMAANAPDFFVLNGDAVYADVPIEPEVKTPDGGLWRNLTTPETAKVAETLAEFRGRFRYARMDAHLRALTARVPVLALWDDHEVNNNWYPGAVIDDDPRYAERRVDVLSARGRRAFLEHLPVRRHETEPLRLYRRIAYGPLLDLFLLDMRSYRGPNGDNDAPAPGTGTALLGARQAAWLKAALAASRARWKVIVAQQPLGVVVYESWRTKTGSDNAANRGGPPLGREHEIADVLRHIKQRGIANVIWLAGDVHYTAAHHFHPDRARFKDFAPFWEFISGPIHATAFGPNDPDDTFGPEVRFMKVPETIQVRPPREDLLFFGHAHIDGTSAALTVTLKDALDRALYAVTLEPE